jgi:hypothetical protein
LKHTRTYPIHTLKRQQTFIESQSLAEAVTKSLHPAKKIAFSKRRPEAKVVEINGA